MDDISAPNAPAPRRIRIAHNVATGEAKVTNAYSFLDSLGAVHVAGSNSRRYDHHVAAQMRGDLYGAFCWFSAEQAYAPDRNVPAN